MIRFELKTSAGKAIVQIDADHPDAHAAIEFGGEQAAIEQIRRDVERSPGLYGHELADSTSPLDLRAAMAQEPLSMYLPKLLEGTEVFELPREDPPEDSVE